MSLKLILPLAVAALTMVVLIFAIVEPLYVRAKEKRQLREFQRI